MTSMILVELPASLRLLAGIRHEVRVSVDGAVTQRRNDLDFHFAGGIAKPYDRHAAFRLLPRKVTIVNLSHRRPQNVY